MDRPVTIVKAYVTDEGAHESPFIHVGDVEWRFYEDAGSSVDYVGDLWSAITSYQAVHNPLASFVFRLCPPHA